MSPTHFIPVTIPSGQSTSAAVKLDHGEVLVGIRMPAAWTSASISLEATVDGTNFQPVKLSPYGGTYGLLRIQVDAGSWVVIDPVLVIGIRWFRLRAVDSNGNPVNQAASRTLELVATKT